MLHCMRLVEQFRLPTVAVFLVAKLLYQLGDGV